MPHRGGHVYKSRAESWARPETAPGGWPPVRTVPFPNELFKYYHFLWVPRVKELGNLLIMERTE